METWKGGLNMKNDRNWLFHKNCVELNIYTGVKITCTLSSLAFHPGLLRIKTGLSTTRMLAQISFVAIRSENVQNAITKKEVTNAQPALSMTLVNVCPLNYYVTAQHQWVCHGQDSMRGAHIYLARKQMDGGSEHTTEDPKLKRFPQRAETTCPQTLQRTSSTHLWRYMHVSSC